jgi:hypothetical protein
VIGGASVLSLAAVGGAGAAAGVVPVPRRSRQMMADTGTQRRHPRCTGRPGPPGAGTFGGCEVGLWTAVPAGHGAGNGLPVRLILHGGSATTANYTAFGSANLLTSAVRHGAPPFVLAGADGGPSRWEGDGAGDDPQRMAREELPAWCTASDPFFPAVQQVVRLIQPHPAVAAWSKDAQQRGYWNRVTPAAASPDGSRR